jgi:hypothetical protein
VGAAAYRASAKPPPIGKLALGENPDRAIRRTWLDLQHNEGFDRLAESLVFVYTAERRVAWLVRMTAPRVRDWQKQHYGLVYSLYSHGELYVVPSAKIT